MVRKSVNALPLTTLLEIVQRGWSRQMRDLPYLRVAVCFLPNAPRSHFLTVLGDPYTPKRECSAKMCPLGFWQKLRLRLEEQIPINFPRIGGYRRVHAKIEYKK